MTDKNVAILTEAKALIEEPDTWTKRAYQKDLPNGKRAYCAIGAFEAVVDAALGMSLLEALRRGMHIRDYVGYGKDARKCLRASVPSQFVNVSHYNDDARTTHSNIMALYDKAIKLAKRAANDERM